MKFNVISDIHISHNTKMTSNDFVCGCDKSLPLIIAGDISNDAKEAADFIKEIAPMFPVVIFVPGNHDYYVYGIKKTNKIFEELEKEIQNFIFGNRKVVEFFGQRFVCSTLWYKKDMFEFRFPRWPDFNCKLEKEEIYEENKKDMEFFVDNIKEGDIVVSHHMPSFHFIREEFKRYDTNIFFCSELFGSLGVNPKSFIFGHIHTPIEEEMFGVKLKCNPLGYPHENLIPSFYSSCIVEM